MGARRGLRERQRLVKQRTAHGNRIKGLLKTQGIMAFDPRAPDAVARLDALVTGDGRPLGPCLKWEITRELERLALVMRQMAEVEAERDDVVRDCHEAKRRLLTGLKDAVRREGSHPSKGITRSKRDRGCGTGADRDGRTG